MRTSRPSKGEGISALTLSVTTSTLGPPRRTISPSALSQRSTLPSVTDSPSCGIFSVVRPIKFSCSGLYRRVFYDSVAPNAHMHGRGRMARRFRFGICTDQNMNCEKNVERWQWFEKLGFESAWLCDHLIQPSRPQGPYFEAWTLLGGLAAVTKAIRVGVLVTSNTFRFPQVVAKMAVTVDHISNGRLEIGLGAGWYEPEHTMFGIPFPETKELVGRFKEAVQVVDLMTREDTSSFDGEYYQLREARSRPASVQKPRPPLVLGAFGPRMLKIVARYADTWNAFGTPEEMRERNQMLDDYCREIGRDPDTLDRSLYYWVPKADLDPWVSKDAFYSVLEPYVEAGVNQFILDQPRDKQIGQLDWVAAEVLPKYAKEKPRVVAPVSAGKIDTKDWKKPVDHL